MQQVIKRSHRKYPSFVISHNMFLSNSLSWAMALLAVLATNSAPTINLSAHAIVSLRSLTVFSSIWYTCCEYSFNVFRNKPISKFNSVIWPKVRTVIKQYFRNSENIINRKSQQQQHRQTRTKTKTYLLSYRTIVHEDANGSTFKSRIN